MARRRRAEPGEGLNFFMLWGLFGIAAPIAGAGLFGLELATVAFMAAGGFVLAALLATATQFEACIDGARWSIDCSALGDMSGGGDSCGGGDGGD